MGEFILDQSLLTGGVQWCYSLQEQPGAVSARDVSGGGNRPRLTMTQTGTEGTAEFGSAGISPEGTMLRFDPESSGGLTLGADSVRADLAGGWTLMCQFSRGRNTPEVRVLRVGGVGAGCVDVHMSATGVRVVTTTTAGSTTITKLATLTKNQPHMVVVVGGREPGQLAVHVDSEDAAVRGAGGELGSCQGLTVGDASPGADSPHQVAWVAYVAEALTAARVADFTDAGTGQGERSDVRIARLLRWVGIENVVTDEGASNVGYQNTGGAQVLDLIGDVQKVEQGVVFASGDGRLISHSRQRRWNSDPNLTVSAQDVDLEGFGIDVDLVGLVNDAKLTRPRGGTARVVNQDSINTYGAHTPEDGQIPAADDDELQLAAEYMVGAYGTPAPRCERVRFNLLTHDAGFAAAVLDLEVSDRLRITDLPATAPSTTLDLFVEGFTEEISHLGWTVEVNTSPVRVANVFLLDSSLLDDALLAY